MDVLKAIDNIAAKNPYALAIVTEENSISFHQLKSLVNAGVSALQNKGLSRGDRTCLCFSSPSLHFIISLSALKLGLMQFSLQHVSGVQLLNKELQECDIEYFVTDKIKNVNSNELKLIFSDLLLEENSKQKLFVGEVDEDAVAILLRGSGTTGMAKKIPVTFGNLHRLIKRVAGSRDIKLYERHFSLSPLEFFTAKRRLLATIAVGGCVVLRENSSTSFDQMYGKLAIEHLSMAVPHAMGLLESCSSLNRERYPLLKTLYVSGSPVSEQLRIKLKTNVNKNLYIVYGTNEFGEVCIASPTDQNSEKGTVGYPCEGVELELVNSEDKECEIGEIGNVRLKGNACIDGYEGDQAETSRFIRNGWFYPGDLGLISRDGQFVFKGRSDDLIVFDGVNIYPREIEVLLEKYMDVIEVAAFALETNENQIPVLAFSASSTLDIIGIEKYFKKEMRWKAPKFIVQLESLPRNKAGKISKVALREIFIKRLSERAVSN